MSTYVHSVLIVRLKKTNYDAKEPPTMPPDDDGAATAMAKQAKHVQILAWAACSFVLTIFCGVTALCLYPSAKMEYQQCLLCTSTPAITAYLAFAQLAWILLATTVTLVLFGIRYVLISQVQKHRQRPRG